MKTYSIWILAATLFFGSCKTENGSNDASGTFEATETIISAEAQGEIKVLNLEEGQTLEKGFAVGYIDTIQLSLKKKQVLAQIRAVLSRLPDAGVQVAALQEQLAQAKKEERRFAQLVQEHAATQKQLDDIQAQVHVIEKQIAAQQSSLGISSQSIREETAPLEVQLEQLEDQIQKSIIINPIHGTVLAKYSEVNEMAAPGKALYKMGDMTHLVLRAYITGNQLASVKLGQQLKVMVDNGKGGFKEYKGLVSWISDKAEFTPKTIQTKDERANLVFAIKVQVENDGYIKTGMYGEVKF